MYLLIEEKDLRPGFLRNIQMVYNGVFHVAYIQAPALYSVFDVDSGLLWNAPYLYE